ncbi:MAG: LysR family transcriptional regulator [Deltaproteobacteria bacterium]|jgi:DNA-binding transcriptional LysR family regulator|nr:LysR family transcriptional regulator [Deltaproteobacteria bacterium]
MINLDALHVFLEVAKSRNLGAAAKNLNVTSSALSQRLSGLEAQIGRQLFVRKHAGMELSEFGKELHAICKMLEKNFIQINNWILEQLGAIRGTLRISSIVTHVAQIMPYFLRSFLKKYPEVTFNIESNISVVTEERILSRSADIGIITGGSKNSPLKHKLLMKRNDILAVCTPEYFSTLDAWNTIDEKMRHSMILWHNAPTSRTSQDIRKMLKISGKHNLGTINLPDMMACKEHAMRGLGIAFVAKPVIYKELKKGDLIAIPGMSVRGSCSMVYRNEKYESPLQKVFRDEYSAFCKKIEENEAESLMDID